VKGKWTSTGGNSYEPATATIRLARDMAGASEDRLRRALFREYGHHIQEKLEAGSARVQDMVKEVWRKRTAGEKVVYSRKHMDENGNAYAFKESGRRMGRENLPQQDGSLIEESGGTEVLSEYLGEFFRQWERCGGTEEGGPGHGWVHGWADGEAAMNRESTSVRPLSIRSLPEEGSSISMVWLTPYSSSMSSVRQDMLSTLSSLVILADQGDELGRAGEGEGVNAGVGVRALVGDDRALRALFEDELQLDHPAS
jgi:hypothetical protein